MYKLSTKSVDNCGDNLKVNLKMPLDMHNPFKLVTFCTTIFFLIYQDVTLFFKHISLKQCIKIAKVHTKTRCQGDCGLFFSLIKNKKNKINYYFNKFKINCYRNRFKTEK